MERATQNQVPVSVTVLINGESRSVPGGTSLDGLVQMLGLAEDRVAVEHNRQIVRKPWWGNIRLENGDRIEIVHFVGGG